MDQIERQSERPHDHDEAKERLFPEGWLKICEERERPKSDADQNKSAQILNPLTEDPESRWRTINRRIEKLAPAINLVLAMGVVFFAGAQWATSCSNNASTTTQTQQLITAAQLNAAAADKNAAAASSFADSAQRMSRGIDNAVDRLNTQSLATADIAQATNNEVVQSVGQTALLTTQFDATQRPRVKIDAALDGPIKISAKGLEAKVKVTATNVGHLPAKKLRFNAQGIFLGWEHTPATVTNAQDKICSDLTTDGPQGFKNDSILRALVHSQFASVTAFPGDPKDGEFPLSMARKSFDLMMKPIRDEGFGAGNGAHFFTRHGPADVGIPVFGVVGCAVYEADYSAGQNHYTRFFYILGNINLMIDDSEQTPVLIETDIGNDYD